MQGAGCKSTAQKIMYDIPRNIDDLPIQPVLKGVRKSTPEALNLPKWQPLVESILSVRGQHKVTTSHSP